MAYNSKYTGAEVDAALDLANTALQAEQYKGTVGTADTSETLDDVDTNTYVKYVAQTLTEEQQAQTRENIGAASISDLEGLDFSKLQTSKSISILFIGNSLTQDGIAYLPYMLKNYYPEIDFKLYMWYIGGYTLEQHYSVFTSNGYANIFSVAENTESWTNYSKNRTMATVLSTYQFDIVCMQEYFNYKTEYTEATDWNNCRDYIVSNYTGGNALEFISLFHAPLRKDGYDVHEVYKQTEDGNALILQSTISEDVIPNGVAVYRALDTDLNNLGDLGQLSPDGTHTQEGLPCLLQTYVTLCWLFDRLGINKSVYGHPMRMTTAIYNKISVPGANLGSGVVQGTDAQNLLAQEVAIKAYKEGKQFVMRNLSTYDYFAGGSSSIKYSFTIIPIPSDAKVVINGLERTSVEVQEGSNVSWEVSKDGYIKQTGVDVVNYDTNKTVTLEEAIVIDSDAQAFVDATGISNVSMIEKLDALVVSLKNEGLWSKIDALYPCVGTTFNQMSYNLKNPNTYRLTTSGTPTIVANTSVYSSEQIKSDNPDYIPANDFHLLSASGSTLSELGGSFFALGPTNAGGTNGGILTLWQSTKIQVKTVNNSNWTGDTTSLGLKGNDFYIASLTSGIICNGVDLKATETGDTTIESWTGGTSKWMIHNGYNYGSSTNVDNIYSPYILKMSGFGRGLTVEEMLKYSAILNTFKQMY